MLGVPLIEALEKLALITKNGLDALIQIQNNANEPLTIGKAIKAIRGIANIPDKTPVKPATL
jgi:hypothetical protein